MLNRLIRDTHSPEVVHEEGGTGGSKTGASFKSAEPLDNDPQFADIFVRELRKKTWSKPARDLLNAISEQLLHSDFDEIAEAVGRFVETS